MREPKTNQIQLDGESIRVIHRHNDAVAMD
jgi:hypothetical protein